MNDVKAKRYAVLRRWRDNPDDFEVYEYTASKTEAELMIAKLPKSVEYRWEVGKYN